MVFTSMVANRNFNSHNSFAAFCIPAQSKGRNWCQSERASSVNNISICTVIRAFLIQVGWLVMFGYANKKKKNRTHYRSDHFTLAMPYTSEFRASLRK